MRRSKYLDRRMCTLYISNQSVRGFLLLRLWFADMINNVFFFVRSARTIFTLHNDMYSFPFDLHLLLACFLACT